MGRARWERANVVGTRDVVHDTPLEQDRRHGPVHNACRRYPTTMVTTLRVLLSRRMKKPRSSSPCDLSRIHLSREIRVIKSKFFYFSFLHMLYLLYGEEGEGGGYYGDSYM